MSADNDTMNEIMRSLGRIEQKIDNHTTWMSAHVDEDKVVAEKVEVIRLTLSRQRGFMSALAAVGAFLGAAIGYAIEYFHR